MAFISNNDQWSICKDAFVLSISRSNSDSNLFHVTVPGSQPLDPELMYRSTAPVYDKERNLYTATGMTQEEIDALLEKHGWVIGHFQIEWTM